MGALPMSMARYMIDQRRDARAAGQSRPDTATLRSQYNQTFGKPTTLGPTSPPSDGPSMPVPNYGSAPNYGSITQMAAPTGGMLPAGGGGVAAPGTSNMPNASMPPAGAMFKKGGKVKKMASGGMTSKSSGDSKDSVKGWGIARGARKAKMY